MLKTVEAEIDVNGKVILLEPVRVTKKTRAIVTLLEETNGQEQERRRNSEEILELLKSPEFANRKSYSAEEIEAQIEEERNSWE
jgi:DTW domain-containing protein YfiP